MASCSGIAVKEVTSSKVYLKGIITGFNSSKKYCLHYFSGGWKNMPRSGTNYTYIAGVTAFDLGRAGCYVPTNDLDKGKQFEVASHEVERTCESRIARSCTKILKYEVTVQNYVYFWVRDAEGNPVNHAKIECAGESFYTDSGGKVIRPYDAGYTYYARCYTPNGYECTDCYESFYLDSDKFINFYMKSKTPAEPVQHGAYFWVRDENDNPVNHAKIECAGESFYTDSAGKVVRLYDAGYKYYAQCHAPTEYECTDCYESFYLDSAKFINFYMKAEEEEEIPKPKPECTEGDKKPDKICVGGGWEDVLCAEGTYTADRKKMCRGGFWEDVEEEGNGEGEIGVGKYLTVAEADERVRMGLPCYIKCVLPILDMLPGIPYTPGAWIPPFCAITTEA